MERYIVDGLVLLIFAITVFYYGKQGFAKSIMTAAVVVGAVIIAKMFGAQVGQWLNDSFIQSNVVGMVQKALDSLTKNLKDNMNAEQIIALLPEQLTPILSLLKIDVTGLAENLISGVDISGLAEQIGGPLASGVSEALGIVVTFFVSLIGLKFAAKLVDGIFHLPVLRTVNGFMGAVLGVIIGFCFSLIFANLFHVIVTLLSADHPNLSAYILPEGSVIYRWLLDLHV